MAALTRMTGRPYDPYRHERDAYLYRDMVRARMHRSMAASATGILFGVAILILATAMWR